MTVEKAWPIIVCARCTSSFRLLGCQCVTRSSWKKIGRVLIGYFIELRLYSVGDEESSNDFK